MPELPQYHKQRYSQIGLTLMFSSKGWIKVHTVRIDEHSIVIDEKTW